ncbi:hypothetical protein EJ05DRAFT_501185 [Pseudovirgaria hyperparasitica]|uniref:Transcription initiation factor TFIID subunit 8 n=1 Tax=Pseudovirgaria hyperparasitica TaxID=470096 RepID=A0A6A6W3Z9_9PEZI|nr:uncharacterized protein EJ05DRAFT_501185 [Pseudovirgaria hyperparasitica]KAF2757658.1 hypothetical protein EJ05DRAFT_501185 [Pseudovirgaria hyperparasitica]
MAGMKRQFPEEEEAAAVSQGNQKRRKIVHHTLHYTQPGLPEPLPLEDSAFFGTQLIRSISVALKAVGFDSTTPAALEAFRAEAEEYMLHFCGHIRQSMLSARRTQALPSDFVAALSRENLEPHDLLPQLRHNIPPSITLPQLPPPLPAEESPPDLEAVLGPELSGAAEKAKRIYIPKHFPSFPDTSTWKASELKVLRETDPQKLRDKANEEGIQAERGLRELMAVTKTAKKKRTKSIRVLERERIWEDTLAAVKEEDENRVNERDKAKVQEEEMNFSFEFSFDGASDPKPEPPPPAPPKQKESSDELKLSGPVMVNYESKYWRKSAQRLI